MAQMANTWLMLQAIQYRVQSEFLIGGGSPLTGTSPFDTWNGTILQTDGSSDLTRYGTNPFGTVSNAIYIGHSKETRPLYNTWAEIIPVDETVYRRAFGGKIWHETPVYFRITSKYVTDWFGTWKNMTIYADSAHLLIAKHAELPNAPIVQAVKEEMKAGGMPTGYYFDEFLTDYLCWGTVWWHRQEYFVQGGIVP